jgi:hypothetical protein
MFSSIKTGASPTATSKQNSTSQNMNISWLASALLFVLVAAIDASPVAADNNNPRVPQTQHKGLNLNGDAASAACAPG